MVQIDMKMPNNCMVCPLLSYIPHENGDDEPVCYYTGDDLPEGYFHYDGGRPEFCPLKEQEAIEPYMDFDGHDVWRCGKCGATIFHIYRNASDEDAKNYAKFCRHCGQAVKWE